MSVGQILARWMWPSAFAHRVCWFAAKMRHSVGWSRPEKRSCTGEFESYGPRSLCGEKRAETPSKAVESGRGWRGSWTPPMCAQSCCSLSGCYEARLLAHMSCPVQKSVWLAKTVRPFMALSGCPTGGPVNWDRYFPLKQCCNAYLICSRKRCDRRFRAVGAENTAGDLTGVVQRAVCRVSVRPASFVVRHFPQPASRAEQSVLCKNDPRGYTAVMCAGGRRPQAPAVPLHRQVSPPVRPPFQPLSCLRLALGTLPVVEG